MARSGLRLLTVQGAVLIYLSAHPDARVREIADAVGASLNSVQVNLRQLRQAGVVSVTRVGTTNVYDVNPDAPLDEFNGTWSVRHLLAGLSSR